MRHSPVASLLVAALVVLRQPCSRNKATARLLLERAAEYDSLSLAEREACRNLADDLDIERAETPPVRAHAAIPRAVMTDWGEAHRQHRVAAVVFPNELKGVAA